MTHKRRKLLSMALFLVVTSYLADHWLLQKRTIASSEGQVATTTDEKYFDLSELSGKDFQKGFKFALAQGIHVFKNPDSTGISLGLFQVKNSSGAKVNACERYGYVELTLKAEGVAYSGDLPQITVRGPCEASDDGLQIQPFLIPLKDLYKNIREKPVYPVAMSGRDTSFTVSAQSLYEELPQYWSVVQIRLYNDTETLSLSGYELISILDQAVTLDFALGQ